MQKHDVIHGFTSFLRYTYEGEGDVTLKLEQQTSDGSEVYAFIDNKEWTNEITFSGIKGENFVPFWCGENSTEVERNATLSYSIDGVKVKETTINRIGWGKVYNLGRLLRHLRFPSSLLPPIY